MFHKISDFCDKIDSLKQDADRLRDYKYGSKKGTISTIEMNNLIKGQTLSKASKFCQVIRESTEFSK